MEFHCVIISFHFTSVWTIILKYLSILVLIFCLNTSFAGIDNAFFLVPHNHYIGQEVSVGLALGLNCGRGFVTEELGGLRIKNNIIIDGNKIKFLVYSDPNTSCVPITPPGAVIYQLGDLGLPVGEYMLELYILEHDVPFPLVLGFALDLVLEIPFEVLAPRIIDSSSKLSLLFLTLFLLGLSYPRLRRNLNSKL